MGFRVKGSYSKILELQVASSRSRGSEFIKSRSVPEGLGSSDYTKISTVLSGILGGSLDLVTTCNWASQATYLPSNPKLLSLNPV